MTQAVHDRLMFAMRSLAGDLKVLSSLSETMAKIISSIGFVLLFDRVRVKGVYMTKIVASDGSINDNFGWSASIDGDYAIIGSPYDDVGANTDQGSAYIFMRSSNVWSQQAMLTASYGKADEYFGVAVSISGEYGLIGANYETIGVSVDQGYAYIFLRSGEAWNQQTNITASDGESVDHFGYSVSLDGDYALIGAFGHDNGGNTNQGAAYIFFRAGVSWNQQAKLTASFGVMEDKFGYSVSIDGDYAIIGAPYDDVNGDTNRGSAYIFLRSGTAWTEQLLLAAADGAVSDGFGISVAIDGNTVIVGADGKDVSGNSGQGGAYIYKRSGSDWSEQAILTASDGLTSDYFGYSVSLSGNYALIGAYGNNIDGYFDQGSAYIFLLSGSIWSEQMQLNSTNGETGEYFGSATVLDGEFAMIGARGDDFEQGSAFSYCLDGQTWTRCQNMIADDDTAGDDLVVDDNTADDDSDGSMMIGGVSIMGLSLISLLMMW